MPEDQPDIQPKPIEVPAPLRPTAKQPTKPRRRWKWWWKLGAVIFGFVLFALLLDSLIMPIYTKRGSIASVPGVVGIKQADAIAKLEEAGYRPVPYEVRFDDKVPEGVIVRQNPEANAETKPGRKVYLIISGGKEMAMIPDLRGKQLWDAKMFLLKANLTVGSISYVYTDSAKAGAVFKQSPLPGSRSTSQTSVNLVVGEGPMQGRVPVPELSGMTLEAAIAKLAEVKLAPGKVNFQSQEGAKPNSVLDQYPRAGDLVMEGATVDIFVERDAPPGDVVK